MITTIIMMIIIIIIIMYRCKCTSWEVTLLMP